MELRWIRHAQPAWVTNNTGVLDPELTETGHQQAEKLAESAKEWTRPTELWVSPAKRAQQTAVPLAKALDMEPTVMDWLNEMSLPPEWEGASPENIAKWFKASRKRSVAEWWEGTPGGEAFHAFHDRITQNLQTVLTERGAVPEEQDHGPVWTLDKKDHRIAIVAHGGTNSVALGYLLGLSVVPWPWERIATHHTGVSRVRATPMLGGYLFGLREHSDVSHMPRTLRSR